VELSTSLQWRAFRDLVEILRGRGNRVFVLIGPLNEHMLCSASLQVYRAILQGAEAWLRSSDVPYLTLATLPRDLYVDLSHPLADGYALLAGELWAWWEERAGLE
jgi:lysophospholipase L1-like esterase